MSVIARLPVGTTPLDEEQLAPMRRLPPLLRAMRPLQWTKNLLAFAPLIFARDTFHLDPVLRSIGAFVAFCAVSSAIYLVNDVRDQGQDRLHPVKRYRPIAAGELSAQRALIAAGLLGLSGMALGAIVRIELLLVLAMYLALMLAYNGGLKNIVILDVMIIALGFVLRAAGGAVAIAVPISPWLYICTFVVSLLVGFGKRRHELLALEDDAGRHRQNLETYTVSMLDQCIAVAAAGTILSYSIYTFQSPSLPDNHLMVLTSPFVVYAVFRYLYLIYMRRAGGSPEVMLLKDRPLQMSVVGWLLVSLAILTIS
ncbi:MAG: decaprenyl-phosphate phosphoribosyltransferase [Thermomicrobiales bacterium]